MVEFLTPFQERMRSIGDDELDRILSRGVDRAQRVARATLAEVKERMGLRGANN